MKFAGASLDLMSPNLQVDVYKQYSGLEAVFVSVGRHMQRDSTQEDYLCRNLLTEGELKQ